MNSHEEKLLGSIVGSRQDVKKRIIGIQIIENIPLD